MAKSFEPERHNASLGIQFQPQVCPNEIQIWSGTTTGGGTLRAFVFTKSAWR
ncbi:MAG TPA: hypothetical protein VGE80_11050 [Schlesneria sp.]